MVRFVSDFDQLSRVVQIQVPRLFHAPHGLPRQTMLCCRGFREQINKPIRPPHDGIDKAPARILGMPNG